MKRQDKERLSKKSVSGLRTELEKLEKSLMKFRIEQAQGRLKDTSSLSRLRDDIAVVKTFIREKLLLLDRENHETRQNRG